MRCDICFGYFPPFDKVDQMIWRQWDEDRRAAEALKLSRWKAGT